MDSGYNDFEHYFNYLSYLHIYEVIIDMDKKQLSSIRNLGGLLLTPDDTKDEKYRIKVYIEWLRENRVEWYSPNLENYRNYLLNNYETQNGSKLSSRSIKAHLSTIRSRYRKILHNNKIRKLMYSVLPNELSPSNKKAMIDELYQRIDNGINPINSSIKIVTQQDIHDNAHIRLKPNQVKELLALPDTQTLVGLRDRAIMSLLLCTGIREAEICSLEVPDLSKLFGGEICLHVRRGKGAKERLIPYGGLNWGLDNVQQWLEAAQIHNGPVFRGFFKGGKKIRKNNLTTRSINQILEKYPIQINGTYSKITPHDFRRTYARSLYNSGMDLLAIRDNLGHVDSRTTLKYIGISDVSARLPKNIYDK